MSNSQIYENEREIPTADASPEVPWEETIHASGWWASHALVWPVTLLGFAGQMALIFVADNVGGTVGAAATVGAVAVGLVFLWVMISAWLGYYKEAKLARRTPDVEWTPTWWLYMIATPILSPWIVAPIYLVQRYRHVGLPWRRLSFGW